MISGVRLFETQWTTVCQASLSVTNSQSLIKLMYSKLVMPSNQLILCHPLLLPSIFPSIKVFSNESVLHIRWLKYWSFSFSISPPNEYSRLISFRMDWLDLLLSMNHMVHLVKAMAFPVVMYGCESWIIKKAEHRRIDAFELWC